MIPCSRQCSHHLAQADYYLSPPHFLNSSNWRFCICGNQPQHQLHFSKLLHFGTNLPRWGMKSSFPASRWKIADSRLYHFVPNLPLMFCLTSYRNHSSAADLSQQFSDPKADNSVLLLFPEHPQTLHTLLQATTCSSFLAGVCDTPMSCKQFPSGPWTLSPSLGTEAYSGKTVKEQISNCLILNSSTWRAVHLGANPR